MSSDSAPKSSNEIYVEETIASLDLQIEEAQLTYQDELVKKLQDRRVALLQNNVQDNNTTSLNTIDLDVKYAATPLSHGDQVVDSVSQENKKIEGGDHNQHVAEQLLQRLEEQEGYSYIAKLPLLEEELVHLGSPLPDLSYMKEEVLRQMNIMLDHGSPRPQHLQYIRGYPDTFGITKEEADALLKLKGAQFLDTFVLDSGHYTDLARIREAFGFKPLTYEEAVQAVTSRIKKITERGSIHDLNMYDSFKVLRKQGIIKPYTIREEKELEDALIGYYKSAYAHEVEFSKRDSVPLGSQMSESDYVFEKMYNLKNI